MPKDLWDQPLSTESPGAAEHYVLAVEKLLSANAGAEEALGLHLVGHKKVAVYDGSWTEWAGQADTPVEPQGGASS